MLRLVAEQAPGNSAQALAAAEAPELKHKQLRRHLSSQALAAEEAPELSSTSS